MGDTLIPGLADELGRAAERRHRQHRRRMRAATAGFVAVVAIAAGTIAATVTSTVDAPPAGAGVEIQERDGRIEVRLTDLEFRADAVEGALRDAGIDAEVRSSPVGPSNLGRFVSLLVEGGPEVAELLDHDGSSWGTLSIAADYRGPLTIGIGRPAEPGESYARSSNALALGEPLACLDLLGQPARSLAQVVQDRPGVDILADAMGTDLSGHPVIVEGGIPATEIAATPYADWVVRVADAIAADLVKVFITEDGNNPFAGVPRPPTGCD